MNIESSDLTAFFFSLSLFPCFFQGVYSGRPRDREALHIKEGIGPLAGEAWLVLAAQDPAGQWEFDLGIMELLGCQWALAGCSLLHYHDLD